MKNEIISLFVSWIWGIPLMIVIMFYIPRPYSYLLAISIGMLSYLITNKLME